MGNVTITHNSLI